jgi:phage terminase large subunit-like protein
MLNPKNKYIQSFEELVEIIKSSTQINLNEGSGDKNKRIKKLLSNYEAFCNYYFPEYCYAPFSTFHKTIQKDIVDKPNNIYLAQWSRGFAKSTHLGLFLPLYLKFNQRLNGVIVGSLNEDMAGTKLDDLQANLQANQRIIADFGQQWSYGNWQDGEFVTKDGVAFYGFGKKQSPRGYRFKWKRPNYGLVDDLNDARQLKNASIADEDKRWVMEELKPALWTREWWLIIAQNKFHDNAVTSLIEADEEIKCKVHKVNIVDAKGESNWKENPDFTKETIATLSESEGAGFIRERLNTPFEEGSTFRIEWLQWCEPLPLDKYEGVLIHYLDPSYKSTDKSDYKAWVLLGKYKKEYHVLKAWGEKTTSKNMWEYAFEVDEWIDKKTTVKHCMESNFIQEEVHKKELERVEEDNNRPLRIFYDKRKKEDKFERIETMQPLFQRGLIKFNLKEKESTGMKLLRSQLLAIEKGSRINDDLPDALEGAIFMIDKNQPRKPTSTRTGKFKKNSNRGM